MTIFFKALTDGLIGKFQEPFTPLREVLSHLGLPIIDEALTSNPSCDAPYHGNVHEAFVALAAFEGAVWHRLSPPETKDLVVAALFHDYDHTAGELSNTAQSDPIKDYVNIGRALTGLLKHREKLEAAGVYVGRAASLITITEYPYISEPTSLPEAILKDADLSMVYLPIEASLPLFIGLAKELAARGVEIRRATFGAKVYEFYLAQKPETGWGIHLAEKHRLQIKLSLLAEALNHPSSSIPI